MGQTADELRADIDQRRENMSGTVEAIEDRVLPGRIIQRRRDAARGWIGQTRARVMGAPGTKLRDGMSGVGSGAQHVAGDISDAPAQLAQRTRGAPLVAGGIAFGLGVLVALVLPETDQERRAADVLEPQLTAATDAAKEVGQHTLETAKGAIQDAAGELKQATTEHAHEAAGEAGDAAEKVAGAAKDGAQEMQS